MDSGRNLIPTEQNLSRGVLKLRRLTVPMSLTRAFEEDEAGPEIRRIFADIRVSFDLPYVPTLFKVLAGAPVYLRLMWHDLGHVAASREFHAAALGMQEFVRSQAISGGWRFCDQERALAEQKISTEDSFVLAGVVGGFARAFPGLVLFVRLMQLGYAGGQSGRVAAAKFSPALSRLITVHVPNEREASLRVWLIYNEIKRFTGDKQVMGLFRALSPFPGYLASSWMDCKRLLNERTFQYARDEIARRASSMITGMPVHDHRILGRQISPEQWHDIEELVDNHVRLAPGYALLASSWRRSFATEHVRIRAA